MTDYEKELLRCASTETNDLSEEGFLKECARLVNAAFAPRPKAKKPAPSVTSFAQRLRTLRKAYGMTQVDLGRELGVKGRGSVPAWETGAYVPSKTTLSRLTNTLRCVAARRNKRGLRVMRETCFMTQTELAHELGMKEPSVICRWETGERSLPRTTLPLLADVLHCTIDDLSGQGPSVNT